MKYQIDRHLIRAKEITSKSVDPNKGSREIVFIEFIEFVGFLGFLELMEQGRVGCHMPFAESNNKKENTN